MMQYYRPVIDDLARLEKWEVAHTLIDAVSPSIPLTLEGYDLLSFLNFKAKRYKEAVKWGEKALPLASGTDTSRAARFNLGKCYLSANYPELAIRTLRPNVVLDPNDLDSLLDYSVALYADNQKVRARELLDKALEKVSDFSDESLAKVRDIITFNLGTHYLAEGEFEKGMQALSIGRKLRIWGSYVHNYPMPRWEGKPATSKGQSVLVIGEGGIGDCIINMRFISHIQKLGFNVSWADNHNLASLFQGQGLDQVIPYKNLSALSSDLLREFDYWVPAMDLPAVLSVSASDLWQGPYLKIPPANEFPIDKESYIFSCFDPEDTYTVGIRWSGNPLYEHDLHRKIPVSVLLPKLLEAFQASGRRKLRVISLQRDADVQDITPYLVDNLYQTGNVRVIQPDLSTASFADTMNVMSLCDCILTSCTSIAHAAAASGMNTRVLVPIMGYYVWAEDTEQSPWYATEKVKVFHQSSPRNWELPIQEAVNSIWS